MNRLLSAWPLLRMLRMGLGLAAIVQGFWTREMVALVFGIFLGATAWMNIGGCGTRVCGPSGCKDPKE